MVKTTRKNRFKKNRQAGRARLRERIGSIARTVAFIVALAVTSGAFILVHDYFTQTDHFQAREIQVTGNHRLTDQQVRDIAQVRPQTNILAVNLATTRKRLLADPWIADATVSRKIPSGLHLHVREEQPLAMVDMGAGERFLINTAGEVFMRQAASETVAWPLVLGLAHSDLPVSGRTESQAFEAVMALLRLADESGSPLPLAQIRRIEIDHEIGATVYVGSEDRAVRLGFGHYRRKCEALGDLMARLHKDNRLKHYRMIDLLDVNRIVMTLVSTGPNDADDKEV